MEVLHRVVAFIRTIRRGRDYDLVAPALTLERELASRLAAIQEEASYVRDTTEA